MTSEPEVIITSLRVDERVSSGANIYGANVPYLIVNCTFKIPKNEDNYLWEQAKGDSEDYNKVLTIDDPERYENWLMSPDGWNFSSKYDGYGKAWIHHDCPWRYIEKFDTFWFREWIASCAVTKTVVNDLAYYKEHGELRDTYRTVEGHIVLQHLRTLQTYWD